MPDVESELLAEGEALLSRRQEIERAIAQDHRGSAAAFEVRAAQSARQRDRIRTELRRITEAADDAGPRDLEEEDSDPGYVEAAAGEDFYAARERLAARDRELAQASAALERRAADLRGAPVAPVLANLVAQREELEGLLRRWRGRCRRLGVMITLERFDEYAAAAIDA